MNWFYAIAGEQRGPIDQQQFENLARQGIITASTLVWHEGMADWQPYSAVAPAVPVAQFSAASPVRSVTGFTTCGNCGQMLPESDMVLVGDRKYCAACKPLALQRIKEGVVVATDAEEIRNKYIKHEASVKSIGGLYYIGAFAMIGGGLAAIPAMANQRPQPEGIGHLIGVGAVLLALAVLFFFTGRGLRRLAKWSRIPVGIISGIGLLNIPFGTLIHGYILYLVFSAKGQMVFSDEYKAIIAQTPHVKYRSSCLLAILIIIVSVIVIGVIAAVVTKK